ncbi:AMP-binding protein [Chloroflexota bacterium]
MKLTQYTPRLIEHYMSNGFWRPETTAELWDRNAALYPHEEAIVDSKNRLTWAEVKLFSDRLALGLLELGLKRDDVMVMQLPNCAESFLFRLGCEKAGVLCATPMATLRHSEMGYIIQDLGAVGVVIPGQFRNFDYFKMIEELRPELPTLKHVLVIGQELPPGAISISDMLQRPVENNYPQDYLQKTRFGVLEVAVIGLTSGTTQMPKFVEHIIPGKMATGIAYGELLNLTHADIILCTANVVAGNGGPTTYNGAAPLTGAKIIVMEVWDIGECFRLIERERPTIFIAVPAQLAAMVKHADFDRCDFSSLRGVKLSTAALPYELVLEWEKKTGSIVVQGYGSAETGGISGTKIDEPQGVRLLTVGKPYRGVKVKIVDDNGEEVPVGDEGEILVAGALVTSGYYHKPELTRESFITVGGESWFSIGDLGMFDEGGNLRLVGRKKDMIVRGGQNIYPVEIEELLLAHHKVAAAAIIAMPDPIMGEKACAYVEPRQGEEFAFEEMITYLKQHKLAPFKLPERLEVRQELPRVGVDKIPKRLLTEDLWQKMQAEKAD